MTPSRLFLFWIAIVLGVAVSPVCVVAETPSTDAISEDSPTAKAALTRAVKQRLDVEGIPVPHPQRDVFIRRES